jgi:hypothetical protein
MHRLRGLRARLPGEGDLRRGRDPGAVEAFHRAQQAVLPGQPGGPALHHTELNGGDLPLARGRKRCCRRWRRGGSETR